MNISNILTEIESKDPEFGERINPRRAAMKDFARFMGKTAVAATPLFLGSLLKSAYGQSATRSVLDILNFALTLELLESNFYNKANDTLRNAYGADEGPGIDLIRIDEQNHVKFLTKAISDAGGTPKKLEDFTYDYTAGNTFTDVFTNYDTFLAVAQAFEDTGVRAYKGQAAFLLGSPVLTAALNIHSVEARHASFLRQVRKLRGANIKPWVTGAGVTASGIPIPATDGVYAGEDNTRQAGLEVKNIANNAAVTANVASECFDEPLTTDQVVAIAKLFITQGL